MLADVHLKLGSLLNASRFMILDMVAMALRAGQSLVSEFLLGGYSDDKGRSARCGQARCPVA
jgi:hypothetical protein